MTVASCNMLEREREREERKFRKERDESRPYNVREAIRISGTRVSQ